MRIINFLLNFIIKNPIEPPLKKLDRTSPQSLLKTPIEPSPPCHCEETKQSPKLDRILQNLIYYFLIVSFEILVYY
ncbi:hypothetical protein ACN4EE_06430 [Geminocystis sp. CENA526]|uniref:hypothetical protein n=1 Tax=Geminocystis sp. CENA526 TaxID=1355871 RepID=UPI003D6DED0D